VLPELRLPSPSSGLPPIVFLDPPSIAMPSTPFGIAAVPEMFVPA
jgi:hypothetical protein